MAGLVDPNEAENVVDPDDFAHKIDFAFQADVGGRLSARWPIHADSASEGGYASLYAITPDWHPIIDEIPAGRGFFVCSGFSGHGFKLAPAVGILMADLLSNEVEPRFDPDFFRFSRYEKERAIGGGFRYRIVG